MITRRGFFAAAAGGLAALAAWRRRPDVFASRVVWVGTMACAHPEPIYFSRVCNPADWDWDADYVIEYEALLEKLGDQ
jgi:hypothetical protein